MPPFLIEDFIPGLKHLSPMCAAAPSPRRQLDVDLTTIKYAVVQLERGLERWAGWEF